jgi:hypothetical protein
LGNTFLCPFSRRLGSGAGLDAVEEGEISWLYGEWKCQSECDPKRYTSFIPKYTYEVAFVRRQPGY